MKNILLTLVILISFILPQDCEEPVEVWFKISNDINSKGYGEIIQIDMSWGYAGSDGIYVYLFHVQSPIIPFHTHFIPIYVIHVHVILSNQIFRTYSRSYPIWRNL